MEDAEIINLLDIIRFVTCFDVAAFTIFIWDYILTFSMEVDLVWNSKWTFMKGLFLFQRYLPFIDTVWLILYRQTGMKLTKLVCRNVFLASGVLMVVGLAASEMILTVRTWAVWNRSKPLSIILSILYVLVWVSCFFIASKGLDSLRFGDQPYSGFRGCFLMHANKDLQTMWVLLVVWDALMLVLMLVPGFQTYRYGGQGRLFKTVYCDGVIYYLYLFLLSLTNIIVIATLPSQFQEPLTVIERVVHSMLTSRVLLDIRAQAEDDSPLLSLTLSNTPPTHITEDEP